MNKGEQWIYALLSYWHLKFMALFHFAWLLSGRFKIGIIEKDNWRMEQSLKNMFASQKVGLFRAYDILRCCDLA